MPDVTLRRSLDELRAELDRLDAGDAMVRARLDRLIAGIEAKLAASEDEEEDSLLDEVREAILQLEVTHPTATAVLNRIAAALGNLGV